MSKRNINDADVQTVVRFISYVTQEVTLIEMTRTWSEADFLYAIERLQTDQQPERRDQLRELYWKLRNERLAADARMASEEANVQRHNEISKRLEELKEISSRLEELKKPHWSIVPNFWITAFILIVTVIGVIVAVLAFPHN
jgi:hypothetical protein